jgi:integrase
MENAVMVGGRVKVGTPKTHHRRSVPYPDFLDETMAAACAGKDRDALLFPSKLGGFLRPGNGKGGWFRGAVKRAQASEAHFPHVTPHDLRHTTASLAISTGANVKAVQRMLGHASAAMTLDVYADLFDDDLDTVAEALSKMRAEHLIRQESDKGSTANRGDQP